MDTDFIIVIAACGAALGLLTYLFLRRGNGGAAAPAPGSAFAKYGMNVHLRDLFRLAVMLEEEGMAFYAKMEGRVSDPETKKLCLWLAGEEEKHRRFAQEHLDKWRPLGRHLTEWPVFLEKVKQEGFFTEPPADSAPEEELAAYAMRQERKAAEFYRGFESSFPEAWRRARLERLVQEELSHEAKLRAAYPDVK